MFLEMHACVIYLSFMLFSTSRLQRREKTFEEMGKSFKIQSKLYPLLSQTCFCSVVIRKEKKTTKRRALEEKGHPKLRGNLALLDQGEINL